MPTHFKHKPWRYGACRTVANSIRTWLSRCHDRCRRWGGPEQGDGGVQTGGLYKVTVPAGLMDTGILRQLNDRCSTLIACKPPLVVLDLSQVRGVDSRVVATLWLQVRLAELKQVELEILASRHLLHWIDVCGMLGIMTAHIRSLEN